MSAATDEIKAYLLMSDSSDSTYGDHLASALLFARAMANELRATLGDWETAVTALEQLDRRDQADREDQVDPEMRSQSHLQGHAKRRRQDRE
jgi:hypothetical protein